MLKLDMSHVQETFSLSAEATTTSEEATPKDNKVLVTLPFVYQADIAMLGKAKPEVVTFNPETKSILMEHGFVLVKQYASPIQQVELSLHVPYVFSESQPPISYVKMIKNCKTSLCHEIRCNLGPFLNRHRIAQIMLYIVFNMTEFTRQAGIWHAFSVGSEGSLKILDNTTFISGATFQKEIRVATVLQKEGPPPAKKVAAWIVAVSAFCGLILFSLIIAGLVHLGFFRRQQREALERLLKEEQDQNEWNEFMVTEAEVEAEKEYFRKSMMAGVEDFNLEDFKGEPGAAFEPELDSATTDEKAVAFANYSYSSPSPPQIVTYFGSLFPNHGRPTRLQLKPIEHQLKKRRRRVQVNNQYTVLISFSHLADLTGAAPPTFRVTEKENAAGDFKKGRNNGLLMPWDVTRGVGNA
ncbi:integrin alpha, putative [Ixodes scapularis]|uniref:Integrin alpha, putative n=1 Tax=Ixodes scapularis TaxID=6945 RepID=B7PDC7_IXOSC|nr:integrin alpha, putative [Ixodes scapularis]|eukprot:XP_002410729.1 integrin alpha, putative [Ixodes scapularis]